MNKQENAFSVLQTWHENIKRVQVASHNAANFFSRSNVMLGIPTIIVTGAVGASAVTDALSDHKWILALLSVLATTLASLQAFLGLSDRSAKHANVATEYGVLKRHIQQFLALEPYADLELETFLTEIRERFDSLTRSTPQIPTWI